MWEFRVGGSDVANLLEHLLGLAQHGLYPLEIGIGAALAGEAHREHFGMRAHFHPMAGASFVVMWRCR
jgi:hypothetical protein